MRDIYLLLIGTDSKETSLIASVASNLEYVSLLGGYTNLPDARHLLENRTVDVVLIGTEVEETFKVAAEIGKDYGNAITLVMEETVTEESLYRVIASGAKGILPKTFEPEELIEKLSRISQALEEKDSRLKTSGVNRELNDVKGKIFSIFSAKGGVGRTFLGVNLAVELSQGFDDAKVILLDLDLEFSAIPLATDIFPKLTLVDLAEDIRTMDADLIQHYITRHDSGIDVLAASQNYIGDQYITAEQINKVIEILQTMYDYIIIEMPSRFTDNTAPALANADFLLLMTVPEIAHIKHTKEVLRILEDLEYPEQNVKLILNQVSRKNTIRVNDVKKTLQKPVYITIPEDLKHVRPSLNQGQPLITQLPKSSASKRMKSLARKLVMDVGGKGLH